MAENIIKSRIMLKYDTLTNWTSSTLVLKKGEVAIAEVASDASNSGLTPPAIGIKVGDGTKTFSQLGWIQSVAGDVYAWAKAATKPTYSANEISGLNDYISGQINDTNTRYRIQTGTGLDLNKYFLQYQDIGTNTWTTNSTLDLSSITDRIVTLENWATTTVSLSTQIGNKVTEEIQKLDVSDTAVAHQFVTRVSESDGKISVGRSSIGADDITSGTLSVSRGGTGVGTFESGEVLVGNGTGNITTKAIDTEVASNSNNLITSGAVHSYVASSLSNITGAMRFIGTAQMTIRDGYDDDPFIDGYDILNARDGDVIITGGGEEFVWYSDAWHILGPENIYAVRGSIVNGDIASNAAIAQTKIAGSVSGTSLADDISNKVDKVTGKGLSTEDYTTAEQTKLGGIEAGAEVNIIEAIKVGATVTTVDALDRSVTLGTLAGKSTISENDLDSALAAKVNATPSNLSDIAYDGDVGHLTQTLTYLVIDCGNGSDKLYN